MMDEEVRASASFSAACRPIFAQISPVFANKARVVFAAARQFCSAKLEPGAAAAAPFWPV